MASGVDGTASRLVAHALLSDASASRRRDGWGQLPTAMPPAMPYYVMRSVHVQDLLAQKDAELRQLAQRIERMEARRGAIDELQQLDALEAQLKVS